MQIEKLYLLNLSQPYISAYLLLLFKIDIVKIPHPENYILSVRSVTLFHLFFVFQHLHHFPFLHSNSVWLSKTWLLILACQPPLNL